MSVRRLALLLLLVGAASSPSRAGAPSPTAAPSPAVKSLDAVRFTAWGARELSYLDARPHFLSRAELLAISVPPPPPNSAAATRADLDELLRLQSARSDGERAAIERHRQYIGICAALLAAAGRSPRSAPRTLALLRHLDADMTLLVFQAKHRFDRARPSQLEPRLSPCIPVPPHPAYPSGHALQGHVIARVLAQLNPARRDALLAAGEQIGREREIAGLHYASDSAASRALGDALLERLAQNAAFRAELEDARAEWR